MKVLAARRCLATTFTRPIQSDIGEGWSMIALSAIML
jgi:hypothetical protein